MFSRNQRSIALFSALATLASTAAAHPAMAQSVPGTTEYIDFIQGWFSARQAAKAQQTPAAPKPNGETETERESASMEPLRAFPTFFITTDDPRRNRYDLANAFGAAVGQAAMIDQDFQNSGNADPAHRVAAELPLDRLLRYLASFDLRMGNEVHGRENTERAPEYFSYIAANSPKNEVNGMKDIGALLAQPNYEQLADTIKEFGSQVTVEAGPSRQPDKQPISCEKDFRKMVYDDISSRVKSAFPNTVVPSTTVAGVLQTAVQQFTPVLQDGYLVVHPRAELSDPSKPSYSRFRVYLPAPAQILSSDMSGKPFSNDNLSFAAIGVDSRFEESALHDVTSKAIQGRALREGDLAERTYRTNETVDTKPLAYLALKNSPAGARELSGALGCYANRERFPVSDPSNCGWHYDAKHSIVEAWVRVFRNDDLHEEWDRHQWKVSADGLTLTPINQPIVNDSVRLTHIGYQENVTHGKISYPLVKVEIEKDYRKPRDLITTLSFGEMDQDAPITHDSEAGPAPAPGQPDKRPCVSSLTTMSLNKDREAGLVLRGWISVKNLVKPQEKGWMGEAKHKGQMEAQKLVDRYLNDKIELRLAISRISVNLTRDLPTIPGKAAGGNTDDNIDWQAAFLQSKPFDKNKITILKEGDDHKPVLSASLEFPEGSETQEFLRIAGLGAHILEPTCGIYRSRSDQKWCMIHFDSQQAMEKGWKLISGRINKLAGDSIGTQFADGANDQLNPLVSAIDAASEEAGRQFLNQLQAARERVFTVIQKAGPDFGKAVGPLPDSSRGFPMGMISQVTAQKP